MFRRVLLAVLGGLALLAGAADAPRPPGAIPEPGAFARVAVEPTTTSIYVGSVSLTMPVLTREAGVYASTYAAKVFPFFFYNERGRIAIEVSDEALLRLARGETIEFSGRGVRDDGATRRVEGRATLAADGTGRLKVRVFYSPRIELIFNTTYRFLPP